MSALSEILPPRSPVPATLRSTAQANPGPPYSAVPTSLLGPVVFGMVTMVVLLGGFLIWAILSPLSSAVIGEGILVVESNRRDVQHLEGGIIQEIHVRDGAEVKAGDVLITLEATRAHAALQIVRGQINANLVLLARLRGEMARAEDMIIDDDLLRRAAVDRDLQDVIQGQQYIFMARRAALQGQVAVLRQRVDQIEIQIEGQAAQERARLLQIDLIRQELSGVNQLLRDGFAPRTRALALRRELARLQGEQGEYLSSASRLRQQIGETQLQILQVERNFQEEVTRALQDTQNILREQQERFIASEDVVRHLQVRAPVAGIVVGLSVFTAGGVAAPGRTLMQIVPHGDKLVIEAQIVAQNVEAVREGQQAQIRFPALPQRSLPMLTGRVLHVSADRLTDERTGIPYFKVRVMPDDESIARISERRLVAGMPAEVTITTGERTAARYLIDPLWDAVRKSMRER